MTFGQAISSCYSKYVTFSGRAARSEFWFFYLFNILGVIVTLIVDGVLGLHLVGIYGPFYLVFALASILPTLSVIVRRLHDIDRSGWWYWIALVPLVGFILLIVWWCKRGDDGENRFGPDPLAHEN
jgi:uncharacterized membrane protein YhaH (DUF805 family)